MASHEALTEMSDLLAVSAVDGSSANVGHSVSGHDRSFERRTEVGPLKGEIACNYGR
jgi:hypothetical protein